MQVIGGQRGKFLYYSYNCTKEKSYTGIVRKIKHGYATHILNPDIKHFPIPICALVVTVHQMQSIYFLH